MRFQGLDLNLLYALKVLLEERSVSGAARRINMTQPALSGALSRLRHALGDELLIPFGRQMVPTAYAQEIQPAIDDLLRNVETRLIRSGSFDPAASTRRFRLVASDYILAVLVARVMADLSLRAPGIRFEVLSPDEGRLIGLDRGDVDLLFTPEVYATDTHPRIELFDEDHVVAGWADNPAFAATIDRDVFLAHDHVVVEFGPQRRPSFAEIAMAELGFPRRVAVSAPNFTAVPVMLPGTMRLAIVQARLATMFARFLPLATAPMPFAFQTMKEVVQFHATRHGDAGLRWLIGELVAAAKATAP